MVALNKWIYTIVVAMVFVTFVEILLPSNAMKKYTRVILGLLIMTIILNPLLSFIKRDFSLSGYSFKFQSELDSIYIKKQGMDYSDKQSQEVAKLFRQNLEKQMEEQIRKELKDKELKVTIDIVNDVKSDKFGDINKVNIFVEDKISPVDRIDKVKIGEGEIRDTKKPSNKYQSLKNTVAAMYDISTDRIEISQYE